MFNPFISFALLLFTIPTAAVGTALAEGIGVAEDLALEDGGTVVDGAVVMGATLGEVVISS